MRALHDVLRRFYSLPVFLSTKNSFRCRILILSVYGHTLREGGPKRTLKNLEFKASCQSLDLLRQHLVDLQAEHRHTMKQLDTYFNVPQGRLKLREIDAHKAELIYYERSDLAESRYSNYQICDIPEPAAFKQIATMAWGVKAVVEKQRELWRFGDTRIHLDEVTNLGQFVELETVIRNQTEEEAQAEHQLVKDALGIKEEDLISVSYSDLI